MPRLREKIREAGTFIGYVSYVSAKQITAFHAVSKDEKYQELSKKIEQRYWDQKAARMNEKIEEQEALVEKRVQRVIAAHKVTRITTKAKLTKALKNV